MCDSSTMPCCCSCLRADKHGAGGEDSDDDAAEDQGAVSSPVSRTGDDGSLAVVEPDGDSSVRFRIEVIVCVCVCKIKINKKFKKENCPWPE